MYFCEQYLIAITSTCYNRNLLSTMSQLILSMLAGRYVIPSHSKSPTKHKVHVCNIWQWYMYSAGIVIVGFCSGADTNVMVVLVVVFTQVMVLCAIRLNSGSSCQLLQFVLNHILLFIVAVGLCCVCYMSLLT